MFDVLFDLIPQFRRVPDLLPWLAYDDETRTFVCDGNYMGFTFSAMPMSGFEDTMEKRFRSLLNFEFPQGTFLQFNLMVFDDVSRHISDLRQARAGTDDHLINTATAKTVEFITRGAMGGGELPVRNATLLISVKLPIAAEMPTEDDLAETARLQREIAEILATVGFQELRILNDTELLYQLNLILNRGPLAAWRGGRMPVDGSKFLRDQVLDYDAPITISEKTVRVGDTHITPLSAKRLPRGGYFGLAERFSIDPLSGDRGIPCAHMITTTIKIEDIAQMRPALERKRQYYSTYDRGPIGRIVPAYGRRAKDYDEILERVAAGDQVHRIAVNFLLFSPSADDARRHATTTRTYLNELGFSVMEDAYVPFQMIRANLPLGIETADEKRLARFKLMASSAAAIFVPIFFEWRGTPTPLIPMLGRGGQVMSFSPFDSGTNYNMTVSAESGAGKSFLSNEMIAALLSTGGKVWVIDVGRSYVKLCDSLDGQFLSFEPGSTICLNPFSGLTTEEEFDEVQDILLNLLATMAAPKEGLSDFQTGALRTILREQYMRHRTGLSVDLIAQACFDRAIELGEGDDRQFREKRLSDIGFGLQAFCSDGQYGKYFNGPATIDFRKNFVLLELEELKSQRHLQTVVLLLLIYQIQNGMYLGDRAIKKMMLIDEAWDLLSDPQIAGFIEAGYRRFRKYNGAACIITQSLSDLHDSKTGRAVLANSSNTIMLQQKAATLDKLASGDHPEFSRALCERLKTVRTIPGRYSEVFIKTWAGGGIGRFTVDPFRALLYTTRPAEVAEVDRFKRQGMSTTDAINAVLEARNRRPGQMP